MDVSAISISNTGRQLLNDVCIPFNKGSTLGTYFEYNMDIKALDR